MAEYRMINGRIYKKVGICDSERCGVWCCNHIVVKVPSFNSDDEAYFNARGAEVKRINNHEIALLIPLKCRYLQPSGKCGIYATRFKFCIRYAKRIDDPFSVPECGIEWREVRGREAQQARSRMENE